MFFIFRFSFLSFFRFVSKLARPSDNVFDADKVYNEFTSAELQTFLENLDQKQFQKIVDFFNNTPKIKHEVEYKCAKCGEIVKYPLEGLLDFFS